ncbi:hypothetical protein ALC62_07475 [Cyphomyrmex costatus]|uniref:Uncharacterized protein n=1 Tax=Cyphomyrmex costatus TaxID=456900 RepID=A0A195CM80_9HYME|nr:hypothetical protein ALC62_07475 [Cyphomyrmex costatus]
MDASVDANNNDDDWRPGDPATPRSVVQFAASFVQLSAIRHYRALAQDSYATSLSANHRSSSMTEPTRNTGYFEAWADLARRSPQVWKEVERIRRLTTNALRRRTQEWMEEEKRAENANHSEAIAESHLPFISRSLTGFLQIGDEIAGNLSNFSGVRTKYHSLNDPAVAVKSAEGCVGIQLHHPGHGSVGDQHTRLDSSGPKDRQDSAE